MVYRLLFEDLNAYFDYITDCFNHQTVYRLLVGSSDSPGNIPDVSITKRCTDCFCKIGLQVYAKLPFQSPNGVQIAFLLNVFGNASVLK